MRDTQIVRFEVQAMDVTLPAPFETAAARRTYVKNLLLTVELAGGALGIGEVAAARHVTGEGPEEARQALEVFAGALPGEDAGAYRRLSGAFAAAHPHALAARAGLEAALLDAWCRAHGVPLYQFFGGALLEVSTDVTIPIVPPAEAAASARALTAQGIRDLKIKVGAGGQDFERVLAVAQAAPGAGIRLDGNQGFTPDEAASLMERVLAAGVNATLYEQPVPRDDLAGLRFVRERVPVPVAADESVLCPADALKVVQAGAADVVNIKLMKSGVLGALDIAAICRAAGVRLMLGCMLETRLGISVAAHLAAGLGCFEFLDLDGHFTTGDAGFSGGFAQVGDRMVLSSDAPGHGVRQEGV